MSSSGIAGASASGTGTPYPHLSAKKGGICGGAAKTYLQAWSGKGGAIGSTRVAYIRPEILSLAGATIGGSADINDKYRIVFTSGGGELSGTTAYQVNKPVVGGMLAGAADYGDAVVTGTGGSISYGTAPITTYNTFTVPMVMGTCGDYSWWYDSQASGGAVLDGGGDNTTYRNTYKWFSCLRWG